MAVKHTSEVTITDLTDGASVTLSAYSASWNATSTTSLGTQQVATTVPQAYIGGVAVACTVGTCTRSDSNNCVVSVDSSGVHATWPQVTITVKASATTGGTVTIPVTVTIGSETVTYDQIFTYSFALKGNTPSITASKSGTTTTILADGTQIATINDGANGAAGLNQATVYLYKRAASASKPTSGTSTYTFATATLSSVPSGWSQTFPVETQGNTTPVWMMAAVASSNTATDTIGYSEWSTPIKMVSSGSNGTNGTNGEDGYNQATVFLYQRAASAPSKPSTSTTYTFSTGALSSVPSGWSRNVPSGDNPCYVTQAVAISKTDTYSIAASAWTTPTKLAEDGDDPYTLSITSSAGTVFKNSSGSTILTCHIYRAGEELSSVPSGLSVNWYKDGTAVTSSTAGVTVSGLTITVEASAVDSKAVFAAKLEG